MECDDGGFHLAAVAPSTRSDDRKLDPFGRGEPVSGVRIPDGCQRQIGPIEPAFTVRHQRQVSRVARSSGAPHEARRAQSA